MADKIYKYKQGKETEALLLPNMSNLSSSIPSQEQEVIRNKIGIGKRSPQTNVSGATNLDVSAYDVFDLTLTAATDFTFINLPTGDFTKPVTIYLTGAFAWTLAQGTEEAGSDAYAGAGNNRIQTDIVSPTKIYYQIHNL